MKYIPENKRLERTRYVVWVDVSPFPSRGYFHVKRPWFSGGVNPDWLIGFSRSMFSIHTRDYTFLKQPCSVERDGKLSKVF